MNYCTFSPSPSGLEKIKLLKYVLPTAPSQRLTVMKLYITRYHCSCSLFPLSLLRGLRVRWDPRDQPAPPEPR